MANLSTEDSKLYYNIWIDSAGSDRNTSHSHTCRVKLTKDDVSIPVVINEGSVVLKHSKYANYPHVAETLKFIDDCKDVFLSHYFKQAGYTDRATLNILADVANGMSKSDAIDKHINCK